MTFFATSLIFFAKMDEQSRPLPSAFKIGLLLLDGFNSMALQAFIDPFRAANYLRGSPLYAWQSLTLDGETVQASNGFIAGNLMQIDSRSEPFDMVVVNASWNPERFAQPRLMNWLRRLDSQGIALCGLDTGAYILAQAGLLKNRRAAIHYEHIAAFRELFPNTAMGEEMFVIDGNKLTCCGGLAAADLSLEIIRVQNGLELANGSGRYIFHERLRSGDESQLPETREPIGYAAPGKLRDAIFLMERNLEQPLRITSVAREVGLSQRQLDRLFKRHTGVSPVRFYLDVRLDRARGLVTQTELSILNIAIACGFSGNPQFAKAYRTRFGLSPTADRVAGRVPFQFRSYPSHAGV